ncbi:MAG: GTPase domain-containing protein [Negativicutes bacterium]|nr:GTPase domain-containing protein [Negativicutes bacterium]
MKEFAVIGRPNSGKTLFVLNFAGFLGCKATDITFRSSDGQLYRRHYGLSEAKRELCSSVVHKTRVIQSLVLSVPVGKTGVQFTLSDTCGVSENIHNDQMVRQGMAQTLGLLRSVDFIIHIIDLSTVNEGHWQNQNSIDREIYRYGIARSRYVLVANKIDLPAAKIHLTQLNTEFNQATVLPVSALTNEGFQAVKSYVVRNV